MHQALIRIVEFMEEERRSRDTFAAVQELLTALTGATCAGRWTAAQQAAGTLHQLFCDLEATGHQGFDARLFPNPSWESQLLAVLGALGYPAKDVEHLRTTITAPQANPETIRRVALRAELVAFAHRAAGRNELLLESLAAGISEAETSRLSRVARGTVRVAQGKSNGRAHDREGIPSAPRDPTPMPAQRAPTVPPVLFLAPTGSPPR
jgi:hypothetical protein